MSRKKSAEIAAEPAPNPIAEALENPAPAPELARPGDTGPERGRFDDADPFPPGCPIQVLGNQQDVSGTQRIYYLNWNGQLVGLEANNRHGKLGLAALFGPTIGWLEANFPQWSKPVREYNRAEKRWEVIVESQIVGFDQSAAAEALVIEGTRRGICNPYLIQRGVGSHAKLGGGMVLHCGDGLLVSQHLVDGTLKGWRWIEPGLHEGFVYSAASRIPRPEHESVGPQPARRLLTELLMTWNFKRPLIDPRLMLGAIGNSMLGGAAPWRSHVLITGGSATGKSTLNGLNGVLHQLFGEGMFRTANTSSAAIRQSLMNSTVPVMIDEFEASADNRKAKEVTDLARIASSGDKAHRGGQDHQAHEFTLRSCFWFSCITMPPIEPQDRNRLAILELQPFAKGAMPPDLNAFKLPALGRQLMRRMIDGWSRLAATKQKFHAALALAGHSSRACDQFGMLLACADVLLHDHDTPDGLPDDEEVAHWATECRPDRLAEVNESLSDELGCVQQLITSQVQARGGDEREMLASWIGRSVAAALAPMYQDEQQAAEKANERLQQMGLKLVNARRNPAERGLQGEEIRPARWGCQEFGKDEPGFLAVAWSHQGLGKLFDGTKWQGGVWRQSLARCEGAIDGIKVKFGRASLTAVLVPIEHVLDETELPNASRPEARKAWMDEQLKGGGA